MIDPVVLATAVVAFPAGVVVGWLAATLLQIRKATMPRKNRTSFTGRDLVLLAVMAVALSANAAVGFLQIDNGRQDRARVNCGISYNEQLGLALNERSERATDQTVAEIELWRNLKETLSANPSTPQVPITEDISAYIRTLENGQTSRVRNPYPPADLCREESAE